MPAYVGSTKPVSERLRIKPGNRVLLVNAPANAAVVLGALPKGATIVKNASNAQFPIVLLFAESRAALEENTKTCKKFIEPDGILWIAYYKGGATQDSDINRDDIRTYAETVGLKTVAQIALDHDWSALRHKLI